jgi:hypothetical protein
MLAEIFAGEMTLMMSVMLVGQVNQMMAESMKMK